jgi:DNA uptake protein ComE-like DNA-binding protein
LKEVHGVGEVLGKMIVDFRDRSGGFSSFDQLYGVYGLSPAVIEKIGQQFYLDQTSVITRLNINKASASDLSTIPGVSFELGRKIWEYVRLREGIEDLSQLVHVDGVDSLKLRLFAVYLFAE